VANLVTWHTSSIFTRTLRQDLANYNTRCIATRKERFITGSGFDRLATHVSAKNQGAALHSSNLGNKFHDVLQLTRIQMVAYW
jgi:hypothetical protein